MSRTCRPVLVLDHVLAGFTVLFMSAGAVLGGCVQASQVYALTTAPRAGTGSVQIERIEGQQLLLTVELERLPAPEALGQDVRVLTVWLKDFSGRTVKAGQLRYDRARRSGNLVANTEFSAFILQVTGERDAEAMAPSTLVLAERKVTHD